MNETRKNITHFRADTYGSMSGSEGAGGMTAFRKLSGDFVSGSNGCNQYHCAVPNILMCGCCSPDTCYSRRPNRFIGYVAQLLDPLANCGSLLIDFVLAQPETS